MRQNLATINLFIIFYSLLFTVLVTVTDAYVFGRGNYIRFRQPEDVWEPPFHTILCENHPIRIQRYADPDKVCQSFMNQMKRFKYNNKK